MRLHTAEEIMEAERIRRSIVALARDRDTVAPPEHVNCYDLAIATLERELSRIVDGATSRKVR